MFGKTQLVELEGPDGSGKTTAFRYLADELRRLGFTVLETRSIGNPHLETAKKLREIVLSPTSGLSPAAMEMVFAGTQLQNQSFYESLADKYDFILSDRGWFSHLAYSDNNVDREFTERLYSIVDERITLPDYVVYLRVDPAVAAKRRTSRGGPVDVIEAKGDGFQAGVSRSFDEWFPRYADDVIFYDVNAEVDIAGVQTQLAEVAAQLARGLRAKKDGSLDA